MRNATSRRFVLDVCIKLYVVFIDFLAKLDLMLCCDCACIEPMEARLFDGTNSSANEFGKKIINFDLNFISFCFATIMAYDCHAVCKDKHDKFIAAAPNVLKFEWCHI